MPVFSSERYDNLTEVHSAYEAERRRWTERRARIEKVRAFTNGLAIADLQGGAEPLTNYLSQYHRIASRVNELVSAVTGTDTYATISATTNDAERDTYIGSVLTSTFNAEVLRGAEFLAFMRLVAGELQITGSVILEFTNSHAWLPEMSNKIVIPYDTLLQTGSVPFAFEPRVLSLSDLRMMRRRSGDSDAVASGFLDELIKEASDQIKGTLSASAGDEHRDPAPLRDAARSGCPRPETAPAPEGIPCWYYYEVREKGEVSCTIYTNQAVNGERPKTAEGDKSLLAHFPKMYDSIEQWIRVIVIDSEIGGTGKLGETRGIAEIIYPSSMMIEFLLNRAVEGDIDRTKEQYQHDSSVPVDLEEVAQWRQNRSSLLPRGISAVTRPNTTGHLSTPMALLSGNVAQLSSTGASGADELRVQSLERQAANERNVRGYTAQFNLQADALMTQIVRRVLTSTVKDGPGSADIARFRAVVEDAGVVLEPLLKEHAGRLRYIGVETARPTLEDKAVEWMTENMGMIPPQKRPVALRSIVSRVTGDPKLARQLFEGEEIVINNQRTVASNEADEWERLAMVGEVIEVRASDIHEDHVPVHLRDLTGLLLRHQTRPWDMVDAAAFSGGIAHTFKHVDILLSNPITKDLGGQFRNDLAQLQSAGQKIIQEAEASQRKAQMSPKEEADVQLDAARLQLEAQKLGATIEKERNLEESRERRARSQDSKADKQIAVQSAALAVNAAQQAEKLRIERERMNAERMAATAPPLQPPSSRPAPNSQRPPAPTPDVIEV